MYSKCFFILYFLFIFSVLIRIGVERGNGISLIVDSVWGLGYF